MTSLMCLGQNKMAAKFLHIPKQGYSEDFMKVEIADLKSLTVYIKQDIRPLLHEVM